MDTKFTNTLLRSITLLTLLSMIALNIPGGAPPVHAAPGDTTRVSVDSSGAEANGRSTQSAISDDGRFVAFESGASNLVSGDTNNVDDIFVHDRQTGTTTRVSIDSSGVEANGYSASPVISNDGCVVAFYSEATNLVDGDTNGMGDVFVHECQTGLTTRISVDSSGNEANGTANEYNVDISGDGRFVVFSSDASNLVAGIRMGSQMYSYTTVRAA